MSPSSHLRLTRRATVGAVLLAAGGCTAGGSTSSGPGPGASSDPADPDFDLGLLDEARVQLAAILDLVRRTSLEHVGLAPALTGLTQLHQAHDELLARSAGTPPAEADPERVPRASAKALNLVRDREVALQQEFATLARRARSGPFARVLASMSAAVAQRITLLPRARKAA